MEAAWWGRVAVDVKSEKLMTYTTSFRPDLETQAGLIIQLAQMKMYGLPAHYLQTYWGPCQRGQEDTRFGQSTGRG